MTELSTSIHSPKDHRSTRSACPEFLTLRNRGLGVVTLSLLLVAALSFVLLSGSSLSNRALDYSSPAVILSDRPAIKLSVNSFKRQLSLSTREFKVIKGDTTSLMMALRSSRTAAGELTLREVDSDGSLGPELSTWVQHYGADTQLQKPDASRADLIISCHPELYDEPELLKKHVFPKASGEIQMQLRVRRNPETGEVEKLLVVFPMVVAAR